MRLLNQRLVWFIAALLLAALACSLLGGGADQAPATSQPQPTEPITTLAQEPANQLGQTPMGSSGLDSEFPLPDDVKHFLKIREGQINYETSLSLEEVLEFYRREFTSQGLTERTLLTNITETTISVVFDGSVNGKMLVVQAVELGPGSVNVNVRYE